MSQSATDLILYKKTEVLLHEVYPVLKNFPKAEKFALAQEIKQAFYALLRNIMLANNLKKEICIFMREKLNLVANPQKSQIFPLKQGANAYGYKIWTTHMKVRDDSKKRMKRKIKAMDRKLKAGEIESHDVKQAVNSWLGHARHSNSFNLCKKIFEPYPYIKIEGEMKFGERRLN